VTCRQLHFSTDNECTAGLPTASFSYSSCWIYKFPVTGEVFTCRLCKGHARFDRINCQSDLRRLIEKGCSFLFLTLFRDAFTYARVI
jgi:hypothetical protein